ncbi:MAG: WD40/YVTN/BNR-like repeat-containing protein [Thermoanaerobaculia bacterium]
MPVIDSVLGPAGGRSYALALDRLPGSGSTPRSLWWTRAPGESRWTLLNAKLSPYYPWSLAPDPVRPDTLYVADPRGTVFRSLDGGATWETRGTVPGGNVRQMLAVGMDLLLMGEPRVCSPCRSEDGGRSWEMSTGIYANELLAPSGDSGVVYAFSTLVIHRSPDGGRSFADVSPAPSQGASDLAVAPSDPDTVYALAVDPAAGFLSRTEDGGASWTRLAAPEAGLTWSGPAVDPASPLHVAVLGGPADASVPRRLFESFDGGRTWTPRAGAVDATKLRFSDGAIEAFGRRGLFATAGPGDPWVEEDRGITADARLLLAGAGDGGLYLTNPESGGVWRSPDAGLTWEPRGSRPGLQSLAADPFDPARLVGIDPDVSSLSWSDDGGRTWTSRKGPRKARDSLPILSVAFDPHRRNVVYASTLEDAWRSADRGATWSRFTGALRSATDCTTFHCFKIRDVESIVPDPFVPARFYAVAHTYDTFRTENGGATWKLVRGPELAASAGPRLLPDPRVKDHLYWGVGIETKVFESLSAGDPPWRALLRTSNFGALPYTWLNFDPRGRLVVQIKGNPATILRRLEDTADTDWESFQAVLPINTDAQLLDPLLPLPGDGTRIFLFVPGLGLFRADLPAAP